MITGNLKRVNDRSEVMQFVTVKKDKDLATITMSRGKVNAFNDVVVDELRQAFQELEKDPQTRALILTGSGKFFSFGFDIPYFLNYSKEEFMRYLKSFTDLYTDLFLFPKPVIAALNGHATAGACMMATACDRRIMVQGKAKISINEIGFGSSIFAGSVEMLKFWVGERTAQAILYRGAMYTADQALEMGLVDQTVSQENLLAETRTVAREFAQKDARAFRSIKLLLRSSVAEAMRNKEPASINEFVDIWYEPETWSRLQEIKIRD
jgi:3,2-trans-enoyl-CoA isomerase